MHYRREVFVEQMPLVDRFVKHLIHYRSLKPRLATVKVKSPFWGDTSDAHLLQACVCWCKVFGKDGTNPTHWKKLVATDSIALQDSFRTGLCSTLGITSGEWNTYWKEMLSFRDKYVAHHELGHSQPVPLLDRALEVAFYYDEWIREIIFPDVLDEKPLRELVEELRHNVEEDLAVAMQAFPTK